MTLACVGSRGGGAGSLLELRLVVVVYGIPDAGSADSLSLLVLLFPVLLRSSLLELVDGFRSIFVPGLVCVCSLAQDACLAALGYSISGSQRRRLARLAVGSSGHELCAKLGVINRRVHISQCSVFHLVAHGSVVSLIPYAGRWNFGRFSTTAFSGPFSCRSGSVSRRL